MATEKEVVKDFVEKVEQYADLITQLYEVKVGEQIDVHFKRKHIVAQRVK